MAIIGALPTRAHSSIEPGLRALRLHAGSPLEIRRVDGADLGICDESTASQLDELHLLLDGRLDNLTKLAAELGLQGVAGPDVLLHAYRRWGLDFPKRLLGDFALALWDARNRRLVLARDVAGYRPLHYWAERGEFRFASEARGLFAFGDIPLVINETKVAQWLTRTEIGGPTFFRNIFSVPSGHTLVFERERVVLHDFWAPENIPLLRLAHPREYAEGLHSVLDQAVAARIGNETKVGSHLSGGLDSSSVTASAARLLAKRGGTLTAFTAVPASPMDDSRFRGRFCDERSHASATAAMYPNLRHVLIPNNASGLLGPLDRMSGAAEYPQLNPGNLIWFHAILMEARQRGLRVLLTGANGNFSTSYDGRRALSTLVGSRQWLMATRLARALHRRGQKWRPLISQIVRPLLPEFLRRWHRRSPLRVEDATGLRPEFALAQGITPERFLELARDLEGRALRIWSLRRLDFGMHAAAAQRLAGIEMTDPTSDRRVMEFCLSVPEEHFIRDGMPRSLIRDAMADRLPEMVLKETRHGRQSADVLLHLAGEKAAIATEIEQISRCDLASRCLDVPRMRTLFAHLPTGTYGADEYGRYGVGLMRALSMGRFLRRAEEGRLFQQEMGTA
ncbi:MAG: asparagine synthase [Proteobacteria bacterium]|nr:asparagine synthase [Pseudomonadota bacterium]